MDPAVARVRQRHPQRQREPRHHIDPTIRQRVPPELVLEHRYLGGAQILVEARPQIDARLATDVRLNLRTTQIPVLEYQLGGDTLAYRWVNVVPGFALPLRVTLADTSYGWIHPTTAWQRVPVQLSRPDLFKVDENFYVETKAVLAGKGGT